MTLFKNGTVQCPAEIPGLGGHCHTAKTNDHTTKDNLACHF